jgi:hypothetical protein
LESPVPAAAGPRYKPRPDLYTVFLIIALVAILIAILFLYLEMATCKFELKGGPTAAVTSRQQSVVGAVCRAGRWHVPERSEGRGLVVRHALRCAQGRATQNRFAIF